MKKNYIQKLCSILALVLYTLTAKASGPPTCSAQAMASNGTCYGSCNGKVWVVMSNATAPFTYSWSSGATSDTANNLCAGTYTVNVTDANSCSSTSTITVSEPPQLSVMAGHTDVSCFGGSNGAASAMAMGGTSPYTYSWSPVGGTTPAASNLSPGTYTLVLTDSHNCKDTQTYVISQPTQILSSFSGLKPLKCSNRCTGHATVTASGGTGAFSYSWAAGGIKTATDTVLCGGYDVVTITDAKGCMKNDSVNIAGPLPLAATTAQVNETCNGGATGIAGVTPSGGTSPYTYSWLPSPINFGLKAGPEICFITDSNGCRITKFFNITQPAVIKPVIMVTNVSCASCHDGRDSVSVTGGTGAYTYSWSPNGCITRVCTGLSAGTYTCCVTDSNGCQICKTAIVDVTGIREQEIPAMYVYPNPAVDYLSVELPASYEIKKLSLFNASGILVKEIKDFKSSRLDLIGMAAGTYILRLETADGTLHKLFIKQ
jgi:hypothetical protein